MQALPLPSRNILMSRDVDEVRAHLCTVLRPHNIWISRRNSDFRFSHNQARLDQVTVNAIQYGTEVIIDAPETDAAYILKVTLQGSASAGQGGERLDIGPDSAYIFNPNRPVDCQLSHDNCQLTLRVPRSSIEQHLRDELAAGLVEPLEFSPLPFKLDLAAPGLKNFLDTLCQDLGAEQSAFTAPRVARQAEQLLIGLLLAHVPHNYSTTYQRAERCPAPYYVKRVEDYIHAHAAEDITLEDMVRAAGISVRSLQTGFRKYRNTTPLEYLRSHRLDLARIELATSSATGRTITEIAVGLGFTHLSKFAKYYRGRFGEAPSQTLLRGQDYC